jgi:hypothetical protein
MPVDYTSNIRTYGSIRHKDGIKFVNNLLNQIHDKANAVFDIKYNLYHKRNLNEYLGNPDILAHLASYTKPYTIITLKEFLITLKTNGFQEEQVFNILLALSNKVCDKIGEHYGAVSLLNCIVHSEEYEMVLAIHPGYKDLEEEIFGSDSTIVSWVTREIGGLLIVQKGECKKMPNTYSVRLICKTGEFKSPVLLGSYLYMAKLNYQDYGVLEVAGGHENLNAFCAYDKFGFEEDKELFMDCFDDEELDNLPMKVDLNKIELEHIVSVVSHGKRLKKIHELCGDFKPNQKASPDTRYVEEDAQTNLVHYMKKKGVKYAKNMRKTRKISKLKTQIEELKRKLKEAEKPDDSPDAFDKIETAIKETKAKFLNARYPKDAMGKNVDSYHAQHIPNASDSVHSNGSSMNRSTDTESSSKRSMRASAKKNSRRHRSIDRDELPSR